MGFAIECPRIVDWIFFKFLIPHPEMELGTSGFRVNQR